MNTQKKTVLLMVGLSICVFLSTFLLYYRTRCFGFVNYDDDQYVYESEMVLKGLNGNSVCWAFRNADNPTCNWHPLTFISLMADVSLFGVDAGAMHIHNAILHAGNSVLVFFLIALILQWLTVLNLGGVLQSSNLDTSRDPDETNRRVIFVIASISALFWALHPLRVESVAWISSRKDVLSVWWFLLGVIAYLELLKVERRASERPLFLRKRALLIGFTFLSYSLAFMSKPTAIVLPVILLLCEYLFMRRILWKRAALFVAFVLLFSAITIHAQQEAKNVTVLFSTRVFNAIAAIGKYIATTIWPAKLSPFYPYVVPVPLKWLASGILILAVVVIRIIDPVLRQFLGDMFLDARKRIGKSQALLTQGDLSVSKANGDKSSRFLLFVSQETPLTWLAIGITLGVLWFFSALIPVIGIIQVGIASRADRYTYLSEIGLSVGVAAILLAKLCPQCKASIATKKHRFLTVVSWISLVGILSIFARVSYRQIGYWRDSVTLMQHACEVVPDNYIARCNLGSALYDQGKYQEAFVQYRLMAAEGFEFTQTIPRLEKSLHKIFELEGHVVDKKSLLSVRVEDGDPMAAEKNYVMAFIAYHRNLYSAAEVFVSKSIQLNPRDGYSHELYALMLYRNEDYRNAYEQLLKVKELLPRRNISEQILLKCKRELQAK